MEAEERRSMEDRREERPGPAGSEAPLLCVLLPSILHFHLSLSPHLLPHYFCSALSSSPQSRTGRSVSGASRDLPRGPQMGCQVQGAGSKGEQKTPKKHSMKGLDHSKMCLIALLLTGAACTECVPRVTA